MGGVPQCWLSGRLCPRSAIISHFELTLPISATPGDERASRVELPPQTPTPPSHHPPPTSVSQCPLAPANSLPLFRAFEVAACRMEIFCMVNLPGLPAAYPLHKFKECFGVVLEGPFFLTSQPISPCF